MREVNYINNKTIKASDALNNNIIVRIKVGKLKIRAYIIRSTHFHNNSKDETWWRSLIWWHVCAEVKEWNKKFDFERANFNWQCISAQLTRFSIYNMKFCIEHFPYCQELQFWIKFAMFKKLDISSKSNLHGLRCKVNKHSLRSRETLPWNDNMTFEFCF